MFAKKAILALIKYEGEKMMFKKNVVKTVLALALAVFMLAGCTSGGTAPSPSAPGSAAPESMPPTTANSEDVKVSVALGFFLRNRKAQ